MFLPTAEWGLKSSRTGEVKNSWTVEGSSFLGEVSTPAHAIWSNYEQFHSKKLLLFVAELKNIKNCGRYSDIVAVRYPELTSVEA